MEDIELVPDARNLMESTRSIGYSLPAAVADIVDNSIAAGAAAVEISTPSPTRSFLSILDDGCGMDLEDLLTAMRYGSRFVGEERGEEDLGRFGLGLKMASLSQCRSLTVLSRKAGGELVGARWDLDHVSASARRWALQILDEEDFNQVPGCAEFRRKDSGTLVVWEKLDILLMGLPDGDDDKALNKRLADLKRHLSLVFHRFIAGKDGTALQIIFNNQVLPPMDPFLTGKSTQPFEEDYFRFAGAKIRYQPFILPHPNSLSQEDREVAGDLQRDQGFYIYRNRRLVIWGTWFRLSRKLVLSKLARVRVDIPASAALDRVWSLDVKKSSATVPEGLKDSLRAVVERLGERSGNVWLKRARKEQTSKDAIWLRSVAPDGTINYEINENNSIMVEIFEKFPNMKVIMKLVSARLPLDSIYSDLLNDKILGSKTNDEKLRTLLLAEGFDLSMLDI